MLMQWTRRVGAGLLLVLGLTVMALPFAASSAQEPGGKQVEKKPEDKQPSAGGKIKWADKYFDLGEFRKKTWPSVFEWLTDKTGLPFINTSNISTPQGTFDLILPRGPGKYNLPQIIDLVNEGLIATKNIIVRSDTVLRLLPADDEIPEQFVARILRDELPDRGNTEIVSITIGLQALVAEDIAPEIKRMMTPFGRIYPLSRANQLILQDTGASLRRVLRVLDEVESEERKGGESYTHRCKYVRATEVVPLLQKILGGDQIIERDVKGAGGGGKDRFGVEAPAIRVTKIRKFFVEAYEPSNSILVNGQPDKINQAKKYLTSIDAPQSDGQIPIATSAQMTLQMHPLPTGNADVIAKNLKDIFKPNPHVQIAASGNNALMVYGGPDTHFEVNRIISGIKNISSPETKKLTLSVMDAKQMVDILKGMFGADTKVGAPFLEVDQLSNTVLIRGSPEQIKEVQAAILAIDGNPGIQAGGISIINLEKGNAATLADAVQVLLQQMRPNPVQVIHPGGIQLPQMPKNVPSLPPIPELKKQISIDGNGFTHVSLVMEPQDGKPGDKQAEQPQIFDPSKGKKFEMKTDPKAPPLSITAFGNKLILSSDDPAALALARELVRLLTNNQAGEGDFTVIRVRTASAADCARILDEAFNGPKTAGGGGKGPAAGGGGLQGMMLSAIMPGLGGGGGATRVERVRVVADTSTNSLLVRATPLDMLTFRQILAQLDVDNTDSEAIIRTFVMPLKNAPATTVAEVIRDVYKESMNATPQNRGGGQGGMPGFMFAGGGGGQQQAQGPERKIMLSVGVDTQTNSLIVACPTKLYKDLEKLVEQLEKAHLETPQQVKVVSVKGVDPALVRQAIEAITGKTTTAGRTGGFAGGGGQGGGFGGGAFTPTGGGFGGGNFGGGFGGNPGGGFGGNPGGGFGGNPGGGFGGMNPGGGGQRGGFGGGGGRVPGGGGGGAKGPSSFLGEPGFFGERVTDDPETSALFDPREGNVVLPSQQGMNDFVRPAQYNPSANPRSPSLLTAAQDAQPQQPQPMQPGQPGAFQPPLQPGQPPVLGGPKTPILGEGTVKSPRLPITVEPLTELGALVIRAQTPADLEAALRIIELIQGYADTADIVIELVPLRLGDATVVTNALNQLFARVIIYQNSKSIVAGRVGGVGGGGQQPPQQPQQQIPGQVQGGGGGQQQQFQATNIVLIPQVRQNAILVAASKATMPLVLKEIERLDVPTTVNARPVAFALKRAGATQVANIINTFYADRYTNEGRAQHHVRVTADDNSNQVLVQASPADLAEIRVLIEQIDSTVSSAENELRIIPLKNAVAANLAQLIGQAVSDGFTQAVGGPQQGGQQGGQPGGFQQQGQQGTAQQLLGGNRGSRVSSLSFISGRKDGDKGLKTGILDSFRISSDPRINALIVTAPPSTMKLIEAMVKELDVQPSARANISVFALKRADATQLALTLQQLFLGGSVTGTTAGRVNQAGQQQPGLNQGAQGTQNATPLQLTLSGTSSDGAVLIDLRLTVDERTNSLIVAGSRSDLDVIESVIAKLEDADIQTRRSETIKLRNAIAADVANVLTDFLTKRQAVITSGNQLTAFQTIQKNVVVVAEPISNSLFIDATPQYFDDVLRLIASIDLMPPMVVIQVMLAEVDLNGSEEFGVEFGLQAPVLFRRGLLNGGITTNTSQSVSGFNFNNPQFPIGNNTVDGKQTVGISGLGSLGVGRVSPSSNIGGFVFSAGSDSVNVLIRALKIQGRIDILSRPQIATLDNQTAKINVGQEFPIVTGSNATANGVITNIIARRQVGVIMEVTPKITPDGRVLMRIAPEVSSVVQPPVSLGNGQVSNALNIQNLETTVTAMDGETILLGGLIATKDTKTENKIPWFGDLPVLGAAFRYRTQFKSKTELIVIMTPRIVRNPADMERVLNEEARKMSWFEGQVSKLHGWPPQGGNGAGGNGPRCAPIWEQNPGDPSRWAPGQQIPGGGPSSLSILPAPQLFQPQMPQQVQPQQVQPQQVQPQQVQPQQMQPQQMQPQQGGPIPQQQQIVPQPQQIVPQIPQVSQPLGPIPQQQYPPQGAMQQKYQQYQQPQQQQQYQAGQQPQQGMAVTQVPQNLPPQLHLLPVVTTVADGAARQQQPAGVQPAGVQPGTNPASQGRETRSWVNTPQ